MKKLTDQELDSLFRTAADGLKPTYDPATWETMNAMLDQPKLSFWKKWMTFTLIGLMTFTTGIWVGVRISSSDPIEIKQTIKQTSNEASVSSTELGIPVRVQNQESSLQTMLPYDSDKNQAAQVVSEGIADEPLRTLISNAVETDIQKNDKPYLALSPLTLSITAQADAPIASEFIEEENPEATSIQTNPDSIPQREAILVKQDSVNEKPSVEIIVSKKQSGWARITLRGQVSPDFSSIKYSSPSRVGSNYGFMVDYSLNSKWSVALGLIKSRKIYDYEGDIAYGTHIANQLDGTCGVLDIPLNAYYLIRSSPRTSWRAGLGFSTYLMLDEDYTYTVKYGYTSKSYTTEVSNENQEWFKMLNLSLLYRYNVTSRLDLVAEPFLKAPLDGVGEGSVKLSTLGMFLGASYKIK